MKQELMNKLINRASKKNKDGVYSYEGHPYAIVNGKLRFVGDFNKILELSQGFAVIIGLCEPYQLKIKIKELFNKKRGSNDR